MDCEKKPFLGSEVSWKEDDVRHFPVVVDVAMLLTMLLMMPLLLPVLVILYFACKYSKDFRQKWAWLFVHSFAMKILEYLFEPVKRKLLLAGCHGRVLDFGCGSLPYADYYAELSEQISEVVALEPNPACALDIRKASERYPQLKIKHVQSCLQDLPSQSVDTVVLGNVLCEVPCFHDAAKDVFRVLKPGGHMIFMEHIGEPIGSRHRKFQDLVVPVWSVITDGCNCNRDQLNPLKAQPWTTFNYNTYQNIPLVFKAAVNTMAVGVATK